MEGLKDGRYDIIGGGSYQKWKPKSCKIFHALVWNVHIILLSCLTKSNVSYLNSSYL